MTETLTSSSHPLLEQTWNKLQWKADMHSDPEKPSNALIIRSGMYLRKSFSSPFGSSFQHGQCTVVKLEISRSPTMHCSQTRDPTAHKSQLQDCKFTVSSLAGLGPFSGSIRMLKIARAALVWVLHMAMFVRQTRKKNLTKKDNQLNVHTTWPITTAAWGFTSASLVFCTSS